MSASDLWSDPDGTRLRHMLDSARLALKFTSDMTLEQFLADEKTPLAVVRLVEVIGEAAKSVSETTKNVTPNVPWRSIGKMRDRLIHGYFDIDLTRVWKVVHEDLPPLIAWLEAHGTAP